MAITPISFTGHDLKGIKRKDKHGKNDRLPAVPTDWNEREHKPTTLEKIRRSKATPYIQAGSMLTSAALITSCTNEVNVKVDNKALLTAIDDAIKLLQAQLVIQQQMLEQMGKQGEQLKEQIEQSKQIMAILTKLLASSENIEANTKEAVDAIYKLIAQSNSNDDEFMERIDTIINSGLDQKEILKQILAANNEQNAKLASIEALIKGLAAEFKELSSTINKWFEQYQNGDISRNELLENIYKEIIANKDVNIETRDEVKELKEMLKNKQITEAEYWEKVLGLLTDIKSNTDIIKDTLLNLSAGFFDMKEKTENYQNKSLNYFETMTANQKDISNKLDKIEANQQITISELVKVGDKVDKINANLEILQQIQGNQLTIDQVKEFFGPQFDELMKLGIKIEGNMIDIDELQAILEKNKVDLTKTNALIETLTTVVQNLDLGSATAEELRNMIAVLNAIKSDNSASSEATLKALQEALDKLGGLQLSMDALVAAANETNIKLDASMDTFKEAGAKFYEAFKKFADGAVDKETVNNFMNEYKEATLKAQIDRESQMALLQVIVDKMDTGKGVDIDELISKLPNYTAILTEIKNSIGNLVTKDDIAKFPVSDLTKTNALIETLTTVLQNKEFTGSGSVDQSEIKELLAQLIDKMESGQLETNKQIDEFYKQNQKILDEVMKIVANTTPSTKTLQLIRSLNSLNATAAASTTANLPNGWALTDNSLSTRQKIDRMNRSNDPQEVKELKKHFGVKTSLDENLSRMNVLLAQGKYKQANKIAEKMADKYNLDVNSMA